MRQTRAVLLVLFVGASWWHWRGPTEVSAAAVTVAFLGVLAAHVVAS
jgi:hypothetical protein